MDQLDKEIEQMGMGKLKIPWHARLLLRFCPRFFMRMQAKKMGIKQPIFDKLQDILEKTERIDFFPYSSGSRGFIIVLDRQTALYFNQDGDHFVYDGFEMGEYKKGEVAIFDQLK